MVSNSATDKSLVRPIVYRVSNHAPLALEDFLGYKKLELGSHVEWVQPWFRSVQFSR